MQKQKRMPTKRCVFCERTIEEIGGLRLVAQKTRGMKLSDRYIGGGNKEFPYKSVKLSSKPETYMVFWGESEKWSAKAVKSAKEAYENDLHPWFCQICGERKCNICGAPINYPMASDAINDDGCISHLAIFPFDPGCTNPKCSDYEPFGHHNAAKVKRGISQ